MMPTSTANTATTSTTSSSRNKSSSKSKSSSSSRRRVRFGSLEIIEFPQVLGDNPACTGGVPLTLDWEPITDESASAAKRTMLIDYYEFTRNPRRSQHQLKDLEEERREYLLSNGYTQQEIQNAIEGIEKIKKERTESYEKSQLLPTLVATKKFLKKPLKAILSTAAITKKKATTTTTAAVFTTNPTNKKQQQHNNILDIIDSAIALSRSA